MKKISLALCLLFFTGSTSVLAEEYKFVNLGWSAEEAVLAQAFAIRSKSLEEKSGFRFDKDWVPKVSLEWSVADKGVMQYRSETQLIYAAYWWANDLCRKYKTPLYEIEPAIVAKDDTFGDKADHELGHVLMDQVSRRAGEGPWFLFEHFQSRPWGEQIGLNIISEGVGVYFQEINYPRGKELSELYFPSTHGEHRLYSYDTIVRYGGYWMVREILSRHGERGLIWIIRNPLDSEVDMRRSAVEYRKRALSELAR